jgi:hypothetical protein
MRIDGGTESTHRSCPTRRQSRRVGLNWQLKPRSVGAFLLAGAPTREAAFTLKVDATAIDDQSSQDNEKHNCGGDRPPIVFGAPWVGPPTVVARPTSGFKVLINHR